MPKYTISLLWDEDATVWSASSDDIPGLVPEFGSFDALMERVRFAIPEVLSLNGMERNQLSVCFKSERHEKVY